MVNLAGGPSFGTKSDGTPDHANPVTRMTPRSHSTRTGSSDGVRGRRIGPSRDSSRRWSASSPRSAGRRSRRSRRSHSDRPKSVCPEYSSLSARSNVAPVAAFPDTLPVEFANLFPPSVQKSTPCALLGGTSSSPMRETLTLKLCAWSNGVMTAPRTPGTGKRALTTSWTELPTGMSQRIATRPVAANLRVTPSP